MRVCWSSRSSAALMDGLERLLRDTPLRREEPAEDASVSHNTTTRCNENPEAGGGGQGSP